MIILNLKDFTKKYNLKNDTMNESELQRVSNYEIYPTDGIISTNKGFVDIDNGILGGTHWKCFFYKRQKIILF